LTTLASTYPKDPSLAALQLFRQWFGAHYARSVAVEHLDPREATLFATLSVARRWTLKVAVVNTLAPDADLPWEAARAAVEKRLDSQGISAGLWVPRGAPLPTGEPGLSEIALAVEEARPLADGRKEMLRTVRLHLRRTSTTGSVVTVLGGLSSQWAQFTNRVPGSYQLNSSELFRLPDPADEREALIDRIVMAAGQPEADESQTILAEDAWTVTPLDEGGSTVFGSARPDNDEQSAALRRNLRVLLRDAAPSIQEPADAHALVVLGAATYAGEEKLTWALRGMDPTLYSGYDLMTVLADGVVKPLLQPGRSTLPWDAPLPG
jgi:hypothetical protein